MKDIKQYLNRLAEANTSEEIDKILDEIVPKLMENGISHTEILIYFKMHGDSAIPKSQDHTNSISNSNKAQIVLQKLLAKLKK
jgi:uncharacterized protein (UPF0297 family)